jgi:hypothetical protein
LDLENEILDELKNDYQTIMREKKLNYEKLKKNIQTFENNLANILCLTSAN